MQIFAAMSKEFSPDRSNLNRKRLLYLKIEKHCTFKIKGRLYGVVFVGLDNNTMLS
jgi:hypothetical protein